MLGPRTKIAIGTTMAAISAAAVLLLGAVQDNGSTPVAAMLSAPRPSPAVTPTPMPSPVPPPPSARFPALFPPSGSPQSIAKSLISDPTQFACFSNVIVRESDWKITETNPSSGAYGIPQALPGSKMASAGRDWRTNPTTQIRWAISYMHDRYGSECGAWHFWRAHQWY